MCWAVQEMASDGCRGTVKGVGQAGSAGSWTRAHHVPLGSRHLCVAPSCKNGPDQSSSPAAEALNLHSEASSDMTRYTPTAAADALAHPLSYTKGHTRSWVACFQR